MKQTYLDILKKYIKNQELLDLILYYNKNSKYVISPSRIFRHPEEKHIWIDLTDMFLFSKTKKGSTFWSLFQDFHHNIRKTQQPIHQWRPLKEWLNELNIKPLLKKCIEHYYATSPSHAAYLVQYQTDLDRDDANIIQFIVNHDRPPNDFDDI